MTEIETCRWLEEHGAPGLARQLEHALGALPQGECFEAKSWNLVTWLQRPKNANIRRLSFEAFTHPLLEALTKTWVLLRRTTETISFQYADNLRISVLCLQEANPRLVFEKLTNHNFHLADEYVGNVYRGYSLATYHSNLSQFARWLNEHFGLRLSYRARTQTVRTRQTRESAVENLLHDDVVKQLVGLHAREDLDDRDRFMLCTFMLAVATGLRTEELLCVPDECLLEEEGLSILFFSEKGTSCSQRIVLPHLQEAVRKSLETILDYTSEGREIAKRTRMDPPLDWKRITDSEEASRYFFAQYFHEYTADPKNALELGFDFELSSDRSWYDNTRPLVHSTAASVGGLVNFIGYQFAGRKPRAKAIARELVFEAVQCQLRGEVYPKPDPNPDLERDYKVKQRPVVQTPDGKPVLWPENALFVLPVKVLSNHFKTNQGQFCKVTKGDLNCWLRGSPPDRHLAVTARFGIVDPESKDVAQVTIQKVRTWVHNKLSDAGMSRELVALYFGKTVKSVDQYDRTPASQRLEQLRSAIEGRQMLGQLTHAYQHIAEHSQEDALRFLQTRSRMVTPMPHGLCFLNWDTQNCPHQGACYKADHEGRCCEHFVIDSNNDQHHKKALLEHETASIWVEQLPAGHPKHEHSKHVKRGIEKLLGLPNLNEDVDAG